MATYRTIRMAFWSDPYIETLSASEKLAPAVVARAARVVRSIQGMAGTPPPEQALERLISNTLQAQGHAALRCDDPTRLPEVYDPAFIHADADLAAIAHGIAAHRSARLGRGTGVLGGVHCGREGAHARSPAWWAAAGGSRRTPRSRRVTGSTKAIALLLGRGFVLAARLPAPRCVQARPPPRPTRAMPIRLLVP